jgi:hypothetical protein
MAKSRDRSGPYLLQPSYCDHIDGLHPVPLQALIRGTVDNSFDNKKCERDQVSFRGGRVSRQTR